MSGRTKRGPPHAVTHTSHDFRSHYLWVFGQRSFWLLRWRAKLGNTNEEKAEVIIQPSTLTTNEPARSLPPTPPSLLALASLTH